MHQQVVFTPHETPFFPTRMPRTKDHQDLSFFSPFLGQAARSFPVPPPPLPRPSARCRYLYRGGIAEHREVCSAGQKEPRPNLWTVPSSNAKRNFNHSTHRGQLAHGIQTKSLNRGLCFFPAPEQRNFRNGSLHRSFASEVQASPRGWLLAPAVLLNASSRCYAFRSLSP